MRGELNSNIDLPQCDEIYDMTFYHVAVMLTYPKTYGLYLMLAQPTVQHK